ncbi:MAG: GNAT family N-acetyltransferase [Bacteroidetes bacterium]|nr:GNAT family N-acetyltransferase [Bacteroidota bacterium]
MPWIEKMQAVEFISNFVKGYQIINAEGVEYAFVIIENGSMFCRIGIYKIDQQNKIGKIGYWVGENFQRRGITTLSCKALVDFCFKILKLNRIEIKYAVDNIKSQAIPLRLNFKTSRVSSQSIS